MPIKKYKTFAEAEMDLWELNPGYEYYQRVATLWRAAFRLNPPYCPRGIFRYRTLEEAQEAKWQWMRRKVE